MASIESVKGTFKWHVETVQVSAIWLGIVSMVYGNVFWRKIFNEAMLISKDDSFYDEMKLIDKCTLTEGWLQNLDIAWYSIILDNLAPAQSFVCWIKVILLQ